MRAKIFLRSDSNATPDYWRVWAYDSIRLDETGEAVL
jgi:hypothetical protein